MTINVALAAWGMSGREFHAPLIAAEPRLRLSAILRRSGPDGSEPEGARCVPNFQAILDDPAIDLVVVNTPAKIFSSVDLPQPFLPIMPSASPFSTLKLTSFSA